MKYVDVGTHRDVHLTISRYKVAEHQYGHLVFNLNAQRFAVFADELNHVHMREDAIAMIDLILDAKSISTIEWKVSLVTHKGGGVSISVRRRR